MRPDVDHPAAVDHHDPVGLDHGAQPVGYHQRRAVLHQPGQRILHESLALGVQTRRGLVENQDRRPLEHHPCDRHPLTLPAAERDATLSHRLIVPVGEAGDELVGVGLAGGLDQLLLAGVETTVQEVLADRAREQHRLLRHQPDRATQVLETQVASVHALDGDPSVLHVEEPRDERRDGRLPRPGSPDQRDVLTGTDLQIDALQHQRESFPVSERHPFEADVAGDVVGQLSG